jgi:hypothetical protein
MSAETPSWKTGACQASVSRRAIVLRIDVSWTTSASGAGSRAAVAAAGAPAAAFSTSSATIRPSGPVPSTPVRSMPRSRAIRRASGEALTRPSLVSNRLSAGSPAVGSTRSTWGGACGGPPFAPLDFSVASAIEKASPSLPMTAIVVPTSTSPSGMTILRSTPSASASTSCVTLSVSSSYSGSRFRTSSPSDFSQRTIVPDSMP